MSRYKGTNVPKQPTVPPMPKKRRYIDESILVEKVYNGEGLPTISRSVLVNCVLPTIPTADVVEVVRCKDCKHFEYDHPYIIQGVPVLGHEVCNAWGDGCKTDENGYCFMAERRTDDLQ